MAPRPWSSSPSGRRIWRHTTPVATSESTYGAKNSVRSHARPRSFWFRRTARPSAIGIWIVSDSTMMTTLCRSAPRKTGSRKARRKLSSPMKLSSGSSPFQSYML